MVTLRQDYYLLAHAKLTSAASLHAHITVRASPMHDCSADMASQLHAVLGRVAALEEEVALLRKQQQRQRPCRRHAAFGQHATFGQHAAFGQPTTDFAAFTSEVIATTDDLARLSETKSLSAALVACVVRHATECTGALPLAATKQALWLFDGETWRVARDDDFPPVIAATQRSMLRAFKVWSEQNAAMLDDDRRNAEYFSRLRMLTGAVSASVVTEVRRSLRRSLLG